MLPAAPSIQPMRLPGEAAPPMILPGQYQPTETYQAAVTSRISEDPALVREAEEAGDDSLVQRDLNNLQVQLANGNMNPRLGNKRTFRNRYYLRQRKKWRQALFRIVGENIEIVGKSSKANEQRVIDRLRELYGR